MKRILFLMTLFLSMVVFTACSTDDSNDGSYSAVGSGSDADVVATLDASLGTGDLMTFTVTTDATTAEPDNYAEAYYPSAEDNLEDESNIFDFATEVPIDVSGMADGEVNGVTITHDGNNIVCDHGTNKVCYVLSGTTTTSSVTIMGERKCEVKLNGVSITSPDSAALNVLCKKRCFIYLAAGTTNSLTDTKCGSDNEHKGALYCKGKLLFHGTGSLTVKGRHNNGIHTADYMVFNKGNNIQVTSSANHGIKANDGIYINGGIINAETSATAGKAINCESEIIVNGGRTTCITTGSGTYDSTENDAKGAAGIKADTDFTINGGLVKLKSTGSGGKGLSTDGTMTFAGGSVYVITEGNRYQYSSSQTSSPKGIKADGNITLGGGAVMIRTSGNKAEGMETKGELTMNGGSMSVYSKSDDAVNSASTMTISGGYVLAYSAGNDGLDANGNMYINGGVIYAICSGSPEVALDANTEEHYTLYVQGGTIIALGGLEGGAQLSQACYQASWSANSWYALNTVSSIIAFKTPASGGNGMVVSAASTPSLAGGVTVNSGTICFGGMGYTNSTISDGTTVSLSNYTATSSMGGTPGGGMMGGFPR